eukprot:m.339519 g.339519  ORF g.339519 m.339519 type:complete len:378 (+) comp18843_c0_seq1:181-1314(+)
MSDISIRAVILIVISALILALAGFSLFASDDGHTKFANNDLVHLGVPPVPVIEQAAGMSLLVARVQTNTQLQSDVLKLVCTMGVRMGVSAMLGNDIGISPHLVSVIAFAPCAAVVSALPLGGDETESVNGTLKSIVSNTARDSFAFSCLWTQSQVGSLLGSGAEILLQLVNVAPSNPISNIASLLLSSGTAALKYDECNLYSQDFKSNLIAITKEKVKLTTVAHVVLGLLVITSVVILASMMNNDEKDDEHEDTTDESKEKEEQNKNTISQPDIRINSASPDKVSASPAPSEKIVQRVTFPSHGRMRSTKRTASLGNAVPLHQHSVHSEFFESSRPSSRNGMVRSVSQHHVDTIPELDPTTPISPTGSIASVKMTKL